MKRVVLIYVLLVIITSFIACKFESVSDYKVYVKEYTVNGEKDKPFNVKYAQISDLGNKSLENKINKTLKSSITAWILEDYDWMEKCQVEVKCKTSKYLSLCYSVEWKDPNGDGFISTFTRIGVTIDMRTGQRVFLNDLFKNTDSLKQKLVNYNYGNEFSPPIDSDEANEIIHETSISEKEYLEEVYNPDQFSIGSKSSLYLKDNKLVITRDEDDLDDVYLDYKQ